MQDTTRPARRCARIVKLLLASSLIVAAGCAPFPRTESAPAMKKVEQLGSADSFTAPVAAWPGDGWWRAYGDSQLDGLIDEGLRGSPDLDLARARLLAASAMVKSAHAARMPEVTGTASFTEQKQSYNNLIPKDALPQGWQDYGLATLNMTYEFDFWGKNRAALAAALSEQRAAEVEVDEARLLISTSIASAYAGLVNLYTLRDNAVATLNLRTKTVELFRQRNQFGLETLSSVREVEARQAGAQADLLTLDESIGLQRNAIAALLGAGPDRGLAIARPTAQFAGSQGLPPNLALDLLGRRPDILAARLRTEAAARRIDQAKAGFYPSVNLIAFVGVQSLGIENLTKSGSDLGSVGPAISLPIFNTERLQGQLRGAHADYDAAVATYNATLTNALREVADAATSRRSLDGELAASRAAVAAAAEAHDIVSRRYQGALATYLDVLTAEDQLIMAQRADAELETRALILDVALVRALGGGFSPESVGAKSNTPTVEPKHS
ncbi:MAG: efflux transporter outer membrane subunit [Gammaproteobacteria bacterium]|nr:efflux transporter outer membrane subunit [Gammaproteobacteria bacterium]MBV8307735.1 efflux transporter outer membrane subunit [Gammaproteobacteria bacterium]